MVRELSQDASEIDGLTRLKPWESMARGISPDVCFLSSQRSSRLFLVLGIESRMKAELKTKSKEF